MQLNSKHKRTVELIAAMQIETNTTAIHGKDVKPKHIHIKHSRQTHLLIKAYSFPFFCSFGFKGNLSAESNCVLASRCTSFSRCTSIYICTTSVTKHNTVVYKQILCTCLPLWWQTDNPTRNTWIHCHICLMSDLIEKNIFTADIWSQIMFFW